MASIQQLRELYGGSSDFETIDLASKDLGLSPAEIADELGMGSRGGKNKQRMSASVDRYQAGLYGVGEAVSGAVGLTGVQNWMRSGRVANETEANVASERARNLGAVDSWAQVHTPSDFGDYAVGLGIQSLPYMGEALAGGFAGRAIAGAGRAALGSTVGVTAASYPSGMGDILQNQREQSGQTDLLSAAGLAIPYAAANVFGVEGALARGQLFRNTVGALDNMNGVRGGLSRAGVTVGRTALTEGASETFQEGMNQFGRMAVDPSETFFNEQSNERFVESFVGGATLGGITGGVAGGWRRSQQWVDSHQPIHVLPDAAPPPGQYTPPDSLTNTPVTELPGFASRPQDPLQEILNPPPPGPSVTINPNAANEKAVANGTATPQQTKAAQVAPEERQAAGEKYRMETVLDDGTEEGHWRLFGRDFFKRADLNKALDRQAIEDRNVDPGLSSFAKELNYATTPIQRPQVLNELARTLYGSTPEKTAYNLNAAIAGGHKEAERLAATYEKLTGQESPAWKAAKEQPAKPAPAPKPVAAPDAPAAPAAPQTFEEDDFDGMARATLLKLFNGNERSVEIALADLRGDKVADITKAYGVSDSLVRKLRDAYTAPKRLELAARQAGVPLEKLAAALAKKDELAKLQGKADDVQLAEDESVDKEVQTSDDRQLAQVADEELTAEQTEHDVFETAGMTVRTESTSQIGDASTKNNSRAKFLAAKENVASKSLTPSDLNNLWVEAREQDDEKLMLAIEREVKMRINRGEMSLKDLGESEDVSAPEETGSAGQPVQPSPEEGSARKKAAGTKQAASKKEPKGQVGDAWDKMASQVKKAGLDLPTWDKLSPEQKTKAQDKFVLNGKLDMREAQKVLSAKDIENLPPKTTGKAVRVKPNGERPMASDRMEGDAPQKRAAKVAMRGDRGVVFNESVSAGLERLDEDSDLALGNEHLVGAVKISTINRQAGGEEGRASEVLKALVDWADANGERLVLVPSSSGKLNNDALRAWYARNGFVDKGDYMTRTPQRHPTVDAMTGEPRTLAGRVRRELEAPLVELRKRESVLKSLLNCLG